MIDFAGLALGAIGFLIGGILKGATGAGAPIIAVPLLSIFYSVPLAVATLTVPSLLANLYQIVVYRRSLGSPGFALALTLSGAAGAAVGSVLLVVLSADVLMVAVAVLVYGYVGFRVFNPAWQLTQRAASRIVLPVGLLAGVLQGSAGLSGPATLTFLNAMRLDRPRFIAVVSCHFAGMAVVQIPALVAVGVMTLERLGLSALACVPLFGAMPIGAWLAKRLSKRAFDRVMLTLLTLVATRLLIEALG
ncbi:MAG: sulfite exporter TauE/SafE family protein [Pseudomonadota bacterium]